MFCVLGCVPTSSGVVVAKAAPVFKVHLPGVQQTAGAQPAALHLGRLWPGGAASTAAARGATTGSSAASILPPPAPSTLPTPAADNKRSIQQHVSAATAISASAGSEEEHCGAAEG
eukprot:scaffold664711_cov48-Prasinocladus_malaysianus.AAC.1